MIQVFKIAYNSFLKNKLKLNYVISIIFILSFTYLFLNINLNNDEFLKNIVSNIFTFSGIFSAILITFIISKIFQIRNEKREVKIKVIELSNKVTDFRRICEIILSNYDVWDSKTKSKLENKYKLLSYQHLYDDYLKKKPEKLIDEYLKDTELKGANFYLGLRNLIRVNGRKYNLELYGDYDEDIIYTLETIEIWHGISCANVFFYYLDHKYHSYKSSILIDNLTVEEKRQIENLSRKINKEKYQDKKFDKNLLVEIGNDFENDLFPKLYNYLYELNESFSKSVNYTFEMLIYIVVFGVFIPLLFPFFVDFLILQKSLVYLSTVIVSLTFLNFIIDFKNILKMEVDI